MPSALEISIYVLLAFMTLAFSNVTTIHEFLLIPEDFSLKRAVLGSIEDLLAQFLGRQVAATLITAIFWALVGMLVYAFLWLFSNFSTELSNDLAITRFMHPQGSDTTILLRQFMLRFIFQMAIGVLLVFYINLLVQVLLPIWVTKFSSVAEAWPNIENVKGATWAIASQVLSLHIFTVFVRLLCFRKRVFDR